jgi:chorismate synthase
VVPDARVIPQLHAREAAELAYYGAKVLHPRALIPVTGRRIPVFVRPFADPESAGTEVSERVGAGRSPVKALTAAGGQALLTVTGNGMLGVPGIAARTFASLHGRRISVSLISQASSEHSICFSVPEPLADDARDALERASARETAARVAAGALAKLLLRELGVDVLSHVVAMGGVAAPAGTRPGPGDRETVDSSPVRCFDPGASEAMVTAIKAAAKQGDSVGGIVEVVAYGVPVGLGSHVHWDRKLDALLAFALMSIQAVKAVELGEGWDVAGRLGSQAHDPITWDAESQVYRRESSFAGGIEGGISTGEPVIARVAMKPLSTLNRPVLKTVDVETKEPTVSFKERTDVTAVPAMGVVAEAMTALVLASEALRKFGGDSVAELKRNVDAYLASL